VRRPLIAIGVVVVVLAAGAVAYVRGIGPLASPTAPASVVFVAISRSTDETDAHEIERIDLAAGTRDLFDVGARISAMALSPDRRSLYVAQDGGMVVLLDATTGSPFGAVGLGARGIVSLSPTADGHSLFAVTVSSGTSAVVPIDLDARKAADPIALAASAGPAVLWGDALVVPHGDVRGLQVAFVDVVTRTVTARLVLPRGTLVPPPAFPVGATGTGIAAFDAPFAGGLGLRVYLVSDPLHWTDVSLGGPLPLGPARQVGPSIHAAATADGTIHVCSTAGTAARRYVLGPDLKTVGTAGDCGPLAGGDALLMATRVPPQLVVIDEKSGKSLRTLPLAGVPARLVH